MNHVAITFGETMGAFRASGTSQGGRSSVFELSFGGAESNVAIALSRLGHSAMWVGRLGRDTIGDRIERELRAEGVIAETIRDESARTGLMLNEPRVPSRSVVTYFRQDSAGSRLRAEDIPNGSIETATLLHVTGITAAISESARAAVRVAIERARASGTLVSFDINHRSSLWSVEVARHAYRWIAERADVVFAGKEEAALISDGETPLQMARGIGEMGPQQVVIKLGTEGCLALVEERQFTRPAVKVDVRDTVGAGDAFVAGYLSELLRGQTVESRLETAVICGAFACSGSGDWENSPYRAELDAFSEGDPVTR